MDDEQQSTTMSILPSSLSATISTSSTSAFLVFVDNPTLSHIESFDDTELPSLLLALVDCTVDVLCS